LYFDYDATRVFEGQDQSIFWLAEKNRKGVVILVNKWDLVEKKPCQPEITKRKSKEAINAVYGCAYSFVSALTKQRLLKSIRSYGKVYENRQHVRHQIQRIHA
jgi:GTP-binding protein